MAKKHIVLVSVNTVNPNLTDGGSRAAYEILQFLRHRGHPVSFCSVVASRSHHLHHRTPVSQRAYVGDVLYGENGTGISLVEQIVFSRGEAIEDRNDLLSRLLETLRHQAIDLAVTCGGDHLSLLAVSILRLPGVHLFNSIDNVRHYERISPAFVGMLRKRGILTVSDFLRRKIGTALKISADVWYNRFDFTVQGMHGHDKGNAVGFYSSGAMIKGEAIVKRLIEKLPHVSFVTVGHPLRCLDESEPGSANFSHLGWIEDMSQFYERLKVLIVPSLVQEGAPRVVIEACSRGIPVIASRLGGIPEALGDSGILVDVDLERGPDIEELAEIYKAHIEHLLGNRELFETYKKQALDRAEAYRQLQEINSGEIYDKYFA